MKPSCPDHCKGCALFINTKRANPVGGMEKYNAWCCAKGSPAKDAIGWCKQHNKKCVKEKANGR